MIIKTTTGSLSKIFYIKYRMRFSMSISYVLNRYLRHTRARACNIFCTHRTGGMPITLYSVGTACSIIISADDVFKRLILSRRPCRRDNAAMLINNIMPTFYYYYYSPAITDKDKSSIIIIYIISIIYFYYCAARCTHRGNKQSRRGTQRKGRQI